MFSEAQSNYDYSDNLGERLAFYKKRSAGPLDNGALNLCRRHNVALAYDPVQIGWVLRDCEDDLAPDGRLQAQSTGTGSAPRLRPWRDDEAAVFVSLLDDPEVWRYLPEPYPAPLTEAQARDLIALSNASAHHEVLAIEVDGAAVGQVRLLFDPAREAQREAEISYWLARRCWRGGIATAAVREYTDRSFRRRPDLQSIVARVHRANSASERVLQKASYRLAGDAADGALVRVWRLGRGERR